MRKTDKNYCTNKVIMQAIRFCAVTGILYLSKMIREQIKSSIEEAANGMQSEGFLPPGTFAIEVSEPKSAEHGDFATNFALLASKPAKKSPLEIGSALAEQLRKFEHFEEVTVAGPGFVNLRLSDAFIQKSLNEIEELGEGFCQFWLTDPQKILVEFVSVNPNGPIHLGHGRGAAFGSVLCRVLEKAGHMVSREFYVNDGANSQQMILFALSVKAKYRESMGLESEFPDDGYRGDYVDEVAAKVKELHGDGHAENGLDFFQPVSQSLMIEKQKEDLGRFGVTFNQWFSEQTLFENNKVMPIIEQLNKTGYCYQNDGALVLKSTDFGDDKDRVVIRSDGRPTYIASDIAYHKDKFERGFDKLINIWGADHHGYVARMSAVIQAMGYPKDSLNVVIVQLVRFLSNGEVVPMSKRSGEMIPLSQLIEDVGVDVARFFYVMRSHDSHMDFDLDLAKEHSDKNPVYYLQYAHARICSLMSKAEQQGISSKGWNSGKLEQPERALIKKIWDLPYEIKRAAETYEVHLLTTYAIELARLYHNFYDKCRVINVDDIATTKRRLAICDATRIGLRSVFGILGISAPESM